MSDKPIPYYHIPFIKGLDLSQRFYEEGVRPLLARHFPRLPYAASRIDWGSDVLGFDTPTSRDHDWGPRLTLFLAPDDLEHFEPQLRQLFATELPLEIAGYPTNFAQHEDGTGHMVATDRHPIDPNINYETIPNYFNWYLRYDVSKPPTLAQWLTFSQQHLRTIRRGRIFHDDLGLEGIRRSLDYYPHDIWLYLMANQWRRLDQEEPFVGRCGHVGDEIGSALVAARQIDNIMRLGFLIAREYAPYYKWFGTAFAKLPFANRFIPPFEAVFAAREWTERQTALVEAYELMAQRHNEQAITDPVTASRAYFHERPYLVIHAGAFADALREAIKDESVLALPPYLGSIDQYVDSTDILSHAAQFASFQSLYTQA